MLETKPLTLDIFKFFKNKQVSIFNFKLVSVATRPLGSLVDWTL